MFDSVFFELKMVVLVLLVIIYNIFLVYVNRREVVKKYTCDLDLLCNIARIRSCSEYEIFVMAAEAWLFSKRKIENDFKEYLLSQHIPQYVKDFVRKMTFQPDAA